MEDERPLTLDEAQMAVGFPLRHPTYKPPETTFVVAFQIDQNIAMVFEGAHSFTLVQGPNIGSVPTSEATMISLSGQQAVLVQEWTGKVAIMDPVTRKRDWSDDVKFPMRIE